MSYSAWKLLHLLAVVAFLGNITTGLFWARHAHRSGSSATLAATFDGIIRSDRWFTMPGVIGMVVAGVALATKAGFPILGTGWILWSIVLLTASGVAFGVWVAPLQREIRELAASGADSQLLDRRFRRWEAWGLVAWLTPLMALVLMVLKPALPAL